MGPRIVAVPRGGKYRDATPMLFIFVEPRNPRFVDSI
jgi:hypothetical protein